MMAACYSMDLYCDVKNGDDPWNTAPHNYDEFPHQFIGETFSGCKKKAVARGWVFKRDGTHICPKHSGFIK